MASGGYFALFVTCAVPSTTIDQILKNFFFVAQHEETIRRCPAGGPSGTLTPIPTDWKSPFIGYSVEQCWGILETLHLGDKRDENSLNYDPKESRDDSRFAVLDEAFVKTGNLLACLREHKFDDDHSISIDTGRFLQLRRDPHEADMILSVWYQDQWETAVSRRFHSPTPSECEAAVAELSDVTPDDLYPHSPSRRKTLRTADRGAQAL